ncbi:MAG: hypothetical protein ABL914_12255 [Novosphingobium sp.]|uniref:hypothetical protein n=1 Tax=Novosphingobium sp. TaxID=1874826 RepID=UPI0032BF0448
MALNTDEMVIARGGANYKITLAELAALLSGGPVDTLTVTPAADLDDYAPLGFATAARLGFNASASIVLSGLAGGSDGREIVISNRSTDFLLVLEHQGTGSLAANRFDLPNGFPFFLMPGDRAQFTWSATSSRWQLNYASSNASQMGLAFFTDFLGGTATANLGVVGGAGIFVSGTGAAAAASTYLNNTVEKPMGLIQLTSGTTATGRAGVGDNGTGSIVPKQGCALSVSRIALQALPTAAETFQVLSGFVDSLAAGALTDGAAWNARWNGAAAEWSQDRFAAAVATRTAAGSPAPDTNYIWLATFLNADWTRADYLYSTDSVNWVKAGSQTTGLPSATQQTSWVAAQIIKSVGTTARLIAVDLAGFRVDYVRG